MAHFAKIGENEKVLTVLTFNNKNMLRDGVEVESVGQAYLEKHNNWPANLWVQTYKGTQFNENKSGEDALRGNHAAINSEWDAENQIFWPEKPHASWVKNTTTANWHSPIGDAPELTAEQQAQNISDPQTNKWYYKWNEDTGAWDLTDLLA